MLSMYKDKNGGVFGVFSVDDNIKENFKLINDKIIEESVYINKHFYTPFYSTMVEYEYEPETGELSEIYCSFVPDKKTSESYSIIRHNSEDTEAETEFNSQPKLTLEKPLIIYFENKKIELLENPYVGPMSISLNSVLREKEAKEFIPVHIYHTGADKPILTNLNEIQSIQMFSKEFLYMPVYFNHFVIEKYIEIRAENVKYKEFDRVTNEQLENFRSEKKL